VDKRSDAGSDADKPDAGTRGGQSQEKVEDRPNVSTTTPDKYPDKASGKDL
jgi:hypothetical protein